mgnify:FL=1
MSDSKKTLNKGEWEDLENLSSTYLICYLNGFEQAIQKLEESKNHLKELGQRFYDSYKDNIRILRKVKYN